MAFKELDYAYNALGQVTSRADYTFIGVGPRTDLATGKYTYNALGLLTGLAYTSEGGANSLDTLGYTYDPLARVSTFSSIDGTATYGYDPTSQLISATYTTASGGHQPPSLSLAYDPNGNRTSVNGDGTTVGGDNHLSSDGTFIFTFDNEGNLITRVRISTASASDYKTVYSWDYRNRLTDVDFYNNSGTLTQHVHYVYDVWDHVIERDLDPNGSGSYTTIVHYVWDSPLPPGEGQGEEGVVLAFDGSQQLIARYLNGPNTDAYDQYFTTLAEEDVTSLSSAGTVTFNLPDPQGSLVDIANSNGAEADHIVYGAFGVVAYESTPSILHLLSWQGGLLDSTTGLENFHERWQYMADGFWASQDPLGFLAGDTNLSRYVGNSPANATDPAGLREVDDRETEATARLADVTAKLEAKVNGVIDSGRKELGIADKCDADQRDRLLRYVFKNLGMDKAGTGLGVNVPKLGRQEVSALSEIEYWLESSLDPARDERFRSSFVESRYGQNPVGGLAGLRVPAHAGQTTADHSMGSAIRIDGGQGPVLNGTDKWGHFFQQGWWYFENRAELASLGGNGDPDEGGADARNGMLQFGMYMEGDPAFRKNVPSSKSQARYAAIARQYITLFKFGYFGSASSGVISSADQAANLAGYRFYQGLYDDPCHFRFRVADYYPGDFNEERFQNQFISGFQFQGPGKNLPEPSPEMKPGKL